MMILTPIGIDSDDDDDDDDITGDRDEITYL